MIFLNPRFESALIDALDRYERGVPVPEILDAFPSHREGLSEIFSALGALSAHGKTITPPETLTRALLARIEQGNLPDTIPSDMSKGRFTTSVPEYSFMNWKLWVPVGIAAVALAGFVVMKQSEPVMIVGNDAQAPDGANAPAPTPTVVTPKPPAKVSDPDTAVAAIIDQIIAEDADLALEDANAELALSDVQALDDFGTVYDLNEL
jgi:hypothetical protein